MSAATAANQEHQVDHVVLIGLDGARADAIRDHAGPVLRSLIDNGTVCWQARAVKPSVTQVNWASMLTGSMPATHGIDRHPVEREELEGVRVRVPSVFEVVAANGQAAIGFLGHWKLYPLESDAARTHFLRSPYNARRAAALAARYLEEEKPAFCFVYMGDLDGLGHSHGWMSSEQLAGLADIDEAVGIILDSLERAGMLEKTIVIISSDHGGSGRSHSAGTEEDLLIPWIAAGPGIQQGYVIDRPISTVDTAATVLHALGLPIPDIWEGRPVREAFVQHAD